MSQTIVAIPTRDEAERIGHCLTALSRQTHRPDAVVLLLNNCTDATEPIARAMAPHLGFRLDIAARDLPPAQSSAGHARRLAMQRASDLTGEDGILLTTDADTIVPPDWIMRNRRALDRHADIVCGRAIIDPLEAALFPDHLHAGDAQEQRLISLLDMLAWMLDPERHDPPPRHTEASGASLAVHVAAFRRIGGIPHVKTGEDRAFVRALWMMDARVRHDPDIKVVVSGRVMGRAEGGMADTIRRRLIRQDEFADQQAEPAADAVRRYSLRNRARRFWAGRHLDTTLTADLRLSRSRLMACVDHQYFGTAWAALEAQSPILRRRRVRFVDLPAEIVAAEALLHEVTLPENMAAD